MYAPNNAAMPFLYPKSDLREIRNILLFGQIKYHTSLDLSAIYFHRPRIKNLGLAPSGMLNADFFPREINWYLPPIA